MAEIEAAGRELLLFRHGHAEARAAGLADFDRALDARGRADAERMAEWAAGAGLLPGLLVSSPARRARETAEIFARAAGPAVGAIAWEARIYEAGAGALLAVLAGLPAGPGRAMLVGHNPGFEDLAGYLSGGPAPRLATAAVARLRLPADWRRLGPGAGALLEVVRPPKR